MKFFKNIKDKDSLRAQYRKLAFENHPDRGGNTEIMKAINAEYEELMKKLFTAETSNASYKGEKTSEEMWQEEQELMRIIAKCILLEGVKVELIGTWIWLSENTYPYKEFLKELGFMFSGSKKAWYFYVGSTGKKFKRSFTKNLDEVRSKFDVREFANTSTKKIA